MYIPIAMSHTISYREARDAPPMIYIPSKIGLENFSYPRQKGNHYQQIRYAFQDLNGKRHVLQEKNLMHLFATPTMTSPKDSSHASADTRPSGVHDKNLIIPSRDKGCGGNCSGLSARTKVKGLKAKVKEANTRNKYTIIFTQSR